MSWKKQSKVALLLSIPWPLLWYRFSSLRKLPQMLFIKVWRVFSQIYCAIDGYCHVCLHSLCFIFRLQAFVWRTLVSAIPISLALSFKMDPTKPKTESKSHFGVRWLSRRVVCCNKAPATVFRLWSWKNSEATWCCMGRSVPSSRQSTLTSSKRSRNRTPSRQPTLRSPRPTCSATSCRRRVPGHAVQANDASIKTYATFLMCSLHCFCLIEKIISSHFCNVSHY